MTDDLLKSKNTHFRKCIFTEICSITKKRTYEIYLFLVFISAFFI